MAMTSPPMADRLKESVAFTSMLTIPLKNSASRERISVTVPFGLISTNSAPAGLPKENVTLSSKSSSMMMSGLMSPKTTGKALFSSTKNVVVDAKDGGSGTSLMSIVIVAVAVRVPVKFPMPPSETSTVSTTLLGLPCPPQSSSSKLYRVAPGCARRSVAMKGSEGSNASGVRVPLDTSSNTPRQEANVAVVQFPMVKARVCSSFESKAKMFIRSPAEFSGIVCSTSAIEGRRFASTAAIWYSRVSVSPSPSLSCTVTFAVSPSRNVEPARMKSSPEELST
mmetsp:Transcript_1795/g.7835  ORF Transcript_1795/g.7835 Transcript_1795/m.7835 type:complete len:281 (+) Transcript_1795:6829-7671(+)